MDQYSPALPVQATLLDAPAGRKLRVERLDGNREICSRLCAMGILPGTEVEIHNPASGKGCVCVLVRQCSLVLGESMARAVCCAEQNIVCPVSERRPPCLMPS